MIRPLTEGGYILCGTSNSPASYEKSSESRGSTDYWIIKIDNHRKILWHRTLGGRYREEAKGVEVLPNHQGYVIYGTSNSPEGVDKATKALGKQDLWIVNQKRVKYPDPLCRNILLYYFMDEPIYKSHNKTLFVYPLFFPSKYRKKVLDKKIDNKLREICIEISERYELHFV